MEIAVLAAGQVCIPGQWVNVGLVAAGFLAFPMLIVLFVITKGALDRYREIKRDKALAAARVARQAGNRERAS